MLCTLKESDAEPAHLHTDGLEPGTSFLLG